MKFKKGLKIISLTVALALMTGALFGCSNGDSDITSENGKTKFSVGAWPTAEGKIMDNMLAKKARFEEANP